MNRVLENIKEEPEEETIEETRLKINLVQSKNRAIKLPSTKIQFKPDTGTTLYLQYPSL